MMIARAMTMLQYGPLFRGRLKIGRFGGDPMMRCTLCALIACATVAFAGSAGAVVELASVYVGGKEPVLDGDIEEWGGGGRPAEMSAVTGADWAGGEGEHEGDADLWGGIGLAHNDRALFVVFQVRDQALVRSRKLSTAEDHVQIWLGVPRGKGFEAVGLGLHADPRGPEGKVEVRKLRPGAAKAGGRVAGARAGIRGTAEDYTVEVAIPWKALRIDARQRRELLLAVFFFDTDDPAGPAPKTVIGTASLESLEDAATLPPLLQSGEDASFEAFLATVRLEGDEPRRFVTHANFTAGAPRETVMVVDRYLMAHDGDIGPGGAFIYTALPIEDGRQILSFQTRDLTGDKRPELILELTEDSGLVFRRWLEVYRISEESEFQKIFGAGLEVRSGGVLITNTYRLVKDGKAFAIEISAGKATGAEPDAISADVPVEAGRPMVLPWDEPKRVKHRCKEGFYTSE
jgi:hypothetical protein